ncbi:MAG: DUF2569 domain-containing protein [Hyphomicrobiales bacterium]
MDFFEAIFIVIFLVVFVTPFFKKLKNTPPKPKLENVDEAIPKHKSTMDSHAEWDEAAWGKSKGAGNKTVVGASSGHNIPSWDKPKIAKPPEMGIRPVAAKRIELQTKSNRSAPDINLDENLEKMGLGFFVVLLVIAANLTTFIYYGYTEYMASSQIGGVRAAVNTEAVSFGGSYSWYINIAMAGVILIIIGLVALLFQWLDRGHAAPKLFIDLFVFMMFFVAVDGVAYNYFFPYSGFEGAVIGYRDVMVLIGLVCFAPYIWASKKVSATFSA